VLEKRVLAYAKTVLDQQSGIWYFKVHGGPFQTAGIPDILGIYRGLGFGIELKTDDGKPTLLQEQTIEQMRAAGGFADIAYGKDGVDKCLKQLLSAQTRLER